MTVLTWNDDSRPGVRKRYSVTIMTSIQPAFFWYWLSWPVTVTGSVWPSTIPEAIINSIIVSYYSCDNVRHCCIVCMTLLIFWGCPYSYSVSELVNLIYCIVPMPMDDDIVIDDYCWLTILFPTEALLLLLFQWLTLTEWLTDVT